MKEKLTASYVSKLTADEKLARHWDTQIKGFMIQVAPSGVMTWYYRYTINTRRQSFKIGRYPAVTATQARSLAISQAGKVASGIDVQKAKRTAKRRAEMGKKATLRGYLNHVYSDHLKTENKTGAQILQSIDTHFSQWDKKQLVDINTFLVGNWRKQQLKKGLTAGGVNRPIAYLRALLNHAYRHARAIDHHPLETFKQLKEDKRKIVRYLSDSERSRLYAAMADRDKKVRQKRESGNAWRHDRGYKLLPRIPLNGYGDYLTPLVTLALKTGMRRGELFNLQWQDIDFKAKTLAIQGSGAKSGNTRIVPLNGEALGTLIKWRNQTASKGLIYPSKHGQRLDNINKSFSNLLAAASITGFRFHDLRHDFASSLVSKGVDLNTVRELLGHSDLQMTMRYAHLSPNIKAEAVELL